MTKRDVLRSALARAGGLRFLESFPLWSGLLTFNYHRIGQPDGSPLDHALWSATAAEFDRQMRHLKLNFDVIGLSELERALSEAGSRRGRFAMVTFDDGYRDNFEDAFPILKSHGLPGVFFIATGFLDHAHPAWWDEVAWITNSTTARELRLSDRWDCSTLTLTAESRADVIRQLLAVCYRLHDDDRTDFLNELAERCGTGRASEKLADSLWMNWDMIREMRSEGMSIGAHTVTHPVLSRLNYEDQCRELNQSRMRLEQELNEPVTSLSYPVGRRDSFNEDTRRALRSNGFKWAFSYYGGHTGTGTVDQFDIPRVGIERDVNFTEFRAMCALPGIFARH